MFNKLFGGNRKKSKQDDGLSEFEWMAVNAIEALKITSDDLDNLTTYYLSELNWCIIRHKIGDKKTFYLLDYDSQEHYRLRDEVIYMDLDEFLLFQEVNFKAVLKIKMDILELIKVRVEKNA